MSENKSLYLVNIIKGGLIFIISCFLSLVILKSIIFIITTFIKTPQLISLFPMIYSIITIIMGIVLVYNMFKYSFNIYVKFLHKNL